ncbi:MAG: hypothetical protein JSW02_06195 [candidate division WOR-3 bacterium]|nr:MAG: hypothetical protein JSW02_06195 [candidate division WOR-3 bacterium]
MRIKYFTVAAIVILTIMGGCEKPLPPDTVLSNCLNALIAGNVTEAYEYFSYDDQLTMSKDEFVKQHELSARELCIADMLRDHVILQVDSLSISMETAKTVVTIITPTLMKERFSLLFFRGCSTTVLDSVMNPQGDPEWIHITQLSDTVLIRKEEKGWRIFGYWQRQRIKEAEASAKRLNYIQTKIEVTDMRAFAFKGERTSYLTARILNNGDETLRHVEIIVVCYNPDNRPCYSVTAYPVSSSSLPLDPYRSKTFRVELPSVPVDWTGNVTAKIVNATFVE